MRVAVVPRLRHFYDRYCEGGFLESTIGDVQLLLARPGNRQVPLLGARP